MKQNLTHPITRRAGFTLVELAIVITIIGILIGGVLKGQQLIDQARLAATINQVNNYRSALMIFKTTYNELPGDMRDPDARIVGCDGCVATVGTLGDGYIYRHSYLAYDMNDKNTESVRAWLHLMKAGIISGVTDAALKSDQPIDFGTTHPKAKMDGGYILQNGTSQCASGDANISLWAGDCVPNGLMLILRRSTVGLFRTKNNTGIFTPQQVYQIDQKIDDGKPATGDVIAAGSACDDDEGNYKAAATNAPSCSFGLMIQR